MRWYFCVFSAILIAASVWTILDAARTHGPFNHLRFAIVQISFLCAAAIFATAWWTHWRRMANARKWAIGASSLSILQSASGLFLGWDAFAKWFVDVFWLPTAFGVLGLIVFSRASESWSKLRRSN
jgi:hypothetical protein